MRVVVTLLTVVFVDCRQLVFWRGYAAVATLPAWYFYLGGRIGVRLRVVEAAMVAVAITAAAACAVAACVEAEPTRVQSRKQLRSGCGVEAACLRCGEGGLANTKDSASQHDGSHPRTRA